MALLQSQLEQTEGIPSHVLPVLLIALYAALRAGPDFRAALRLVLSCGGEADVTAALCGGLLGVQLGREALPARLREKVLYATELESAADKLLGARSSQVPVFEGIPRGKLHRE